MLSKIKSWQVLLLAILFLSAILRFFKLSSVPPGFANDEGAITYQAYSLMLTGKDTWGNFLPVFSFKDFGEYLPPFAVYAQIPFIKILGLNEFAARLPFALTGVVYFLAQNIFNKKTISFAACFIFAVSPFNIGWSRFVFEGNFGHLFYLAGLLFFVLSRKRDVFFPISVFFFGLTLTTYHTYYLVTPLTGIFVLATSANKIIRNKYFVISLILGAIFVLYGILMVASGSGRERFRQVSIFSKAEILDQLNTKRSICNDYIPNPICRLVFNKVTAYGYEYTFNYFSHFSPQFLALNGSFLKQNILPTHGLVYPFEILFFYTGTIILLLRRSPTSSILLFWLIIYPLPNSFTGVGDISRIGFAMALFPIISALGLITIGDLFKKIKLFNLAVVVTLFAATFNIFSFIINYFYVFPTTNSKFGSQAYVQLFKKIKNEKYPGKIYVTRDYMGAAPEFQARIFLPISPGAFQDEARNEIVIDNEKKYISYKRLDNYFFFQNSNEIDTNNSNLVIKSKTQLGKNDKVLFEITEPNGEPSLFATSGI